MLLTIQAQQQQREHLARTSSGNQHKGHCKPAASKFDQRNIMRIHNGNKVACPRSANGKLLGQTFLLRRLHRGPSTTISLPSI